MRLDVGIPHRVRAIRLVRACPEDAIVLIEFVLVVRHAIRERACYRRGIRSRAGRVVPQQPYRRPTGRGRRYEVGVVRGRGHRDRFGEVRLGTFEIHRVRAGSATVDDPLTEVLAQEPIGECRPHQRLRQRGAVGGCGPEHRLGTRHRVFGGPASALGKIPVNVTVIVDQLAVLLKHGNAERSGGSTREDLTGGGGTGVRRPVERFGQIAAGAVHQRWQRGGRIQRLGPDRTGIDGVERAARQSGEQTERSRNAKHTLRHRRAS